MSKSSSSETSVSPEGDGPSEATDEGQAKRNAKLLGKRPVDAVAAQSVASEEATNAEEPSLRRVRRPSSAFKDYEDSSALSTHVYNARLSSKSKARPKAAAAASVSAGDAAEALASPATSGAARRATNGRSARDTPAPSTASKAKKPVETTPAAKPKAAAARSSAKSGKDPKEKALEEMEESLIANALRQKTEAPLQHNVLPEGPMELSDLDAALAQSCADNTWPVLDWSSAAAKKIGCICKVYWDGEKKWFYARILNYDEHHKKHYVFYFADSTAEWISIDTEAVLVGEEIMLAQNKNQGLWPAIVYSVSPKAEPIIFKNQHEPDEVYIEFFTEKNLLDKCFTAKDSLQPLSEDLMPQKKSKKYEKCLEAAKYERMAIDNVVDEVVRSLRNNVFRYFKGEDWLGHRVRAPTHRILTKAEKKSLANSLSPINSVFCTGSVRRYCSQTKEHFVVFEEDKLQPQWVLATKGNIEILISTSSNDSNNSTTTAQTKVEVEGSAVSTKSSTTIVTRRGGEHTSSSAAVVSSALCQLCDLLVEGVEGNLLCSSCPAAFHSYCWPTNDAFKILNESSAVKRNSWKCPQCSVCNGCGANQWTAQLIYWNGRRLDPGAPDKPILLCGLCLQRYKHHREFCTICYKLYESNQVTAANAANAKETETDGKIEVKTESEDGKEAVLVKEENGKKATDTEESMVQCNECDHWVHAKCEGLDQAQYLAISEGTHPIWGDEYLCPICRVKISANVITALQGLDTYQLFAEPVTTSVAANYFDVIRSPMDLSTMRGKNEKGMYKSLQATRQDMELMVLNALVFNNRGDECWRIARDFFLKAMDVFARNRHKTSLSAFGKEAEQIIAQWTPPSADNNDRKRKTASQPQPQTKDDGNGKKTEDASLRNKRRRGAGDADSIEQREKDGSAPSSSSSTAGDEMDVEHTREQANNSVKEEETEDAEEKGTGDDAHVISLALSRNPDPTSFAVPFHSLVSAEEAFFTCCLDQCFICGGGPSISSSDTTTCSVLTVGSSSKAGEQTENDFLYCIDCGEAFHAACAMAPTKLSQRARTHWRCVNCKLCEVCGVITEGDADTLVLCEACDRAFHLQCLSPALQAVPEEFSWFCGECVQCVPCAKRAKRASAVVAPSASLSAPVSVVNGATATGTAETSSPSTAVVAVDSAQEVKDATKETAEKEKAMEKRMWSRSLSMCLSCDLAKQQHLRPQTNTNGNINNSVASTSAKAAYLPPQKSGKGGAAPQAVVTARPVAAAGVLKRDTLTCFDCRQDFVLSFPDRRAFDPFFWLCNPCTLRRQEEMKSNETGATEMVQKQKKKVPTHLGDSNACLSVLAQIARIQAYRQAQIMRAKALSLTQTIEPLRLFRQCNGLYFVMMVLWASLRASLLSVHGQMLFVKPSQTQRDAASGSTSSSNANNNNNIDNSNTEEKESAQKEGVLTAGTQWVTARSRRFLCYARRRIHRHRLHPFVPATVASTAALQAAAESPSPQAAQIQAAAYLSAQKDAQLTPEGKTVRLPLLLALSTEAMTRLAQMASTFLFLTETERYREDLQIHELVLVLMQVSFLLMQDLKNNNDSSSSTSSSTANKSEGEAKTNTESQSQSHAQTHSNIVSHHSANKVDTNNSNNNGTTAANPATATAATTVSPAERARQEERARRVVDTLRSIYQRQSLPAHAVSAMGLLEARRLCQQRRGVHFVVNHNFSALEGADILHAMESVLRCAFSPEIVQTVKMFVEMSFFPQKLPSLYLVSNFAATNGSNNNSANNNSNANNNNKAQGNAQSSVGVNSANTINASSSTSVNIPVNSSAATPSVAAASVDANASTKSNGTATSTDAAAASNKTSAVDAHTTTAAAARPTKSPADLLGYFQGCKNPLISPGFVIPVDEFGEIVRAHNIEEEDDVDDDCGDINDEGAISMREKERTVRVQTWRAGGLARSRLLSSQPHRSPYLDPLPYAESAPVAKTGRASKKHEKIEILHDNTRGSGKSEPLPSSSDAALSSHGRSSHTPSDVHAHTHADVVLAKNDYQRYFIDAIHGARVEVQSLCKDMDSAQDFDSLDTKKLVDAMLAKYMEPAPSVSVGETETETVSAQQTQMQTQAQKVNASTATHTAADSANADATVNENESVTENSSAVSVTIASSSSSGSDSSALSVAEKGSEAVEQKNKEEIGSRGDPEEKMDIADDKEREKESVKTQEETQAMEVEPKSTQLTVVEKNSVEFAEEKKENNFADSIAMRGWSADYCFAEQDWMDPRSCVFCSEGDTDPHTLGRLLPFSDGAFAHTNCLVGCPEVEEVETVLLNAYHARERGFRQTCYLCHKRGATFACCQQIKRCRRVFHLKCALACKALLFAKEEPVNAKKNKGKGKKKNKDDKTDGNANADNDTDDEKPGNRRSVVTICPAHADFQLNTRGKHSKLSLQPWAPQATERCVIIERQDVESESKRIATVLSQRRTDKAARTGALTVFSVGALSTQHCEFFSSPERVYPVGFRSTRVFWSMQRPRTRTLYIFEVLSVTETESWDAEQTEYLHAMLEEIATFPTRYNYGNNNKTSSQNNNNNNNKVKTDVDNCSDSAKESGENNESAVSLSSSQPTTASLSLSLLVPGPLFRCVAMDHAHAPLFARSLEQLHAYILCRARDCNAADLFTTHCETKTKTESERRAFILERPKWSGYGLTPSQFFGLGVPLVRMAIELLPDAVAAMTLADEARRYKPCFRLPTAAELRAMQHVLHGLRRGDGFNLGNSNGNGSSRANPFVSASGAGNGVRLTRILTKIADADAVGAETLCGLAAGQEDNENDNDYAADFEQEGNLAEIENRVYKFLHMTAAYVRNPQTKLEVRKSTIHGWGLFAKINFEKDDVLVEYIGEKIRQAVADRREVLYEQNGVGSCYLFRLDKDDIVDATATGAMARFMNHCCEPNAYAKVITFFSNGVEEKHIVILAARDIQEGEEITYDYKFPIEDKKLKCYCGAPKCSGSMN